MLVRPVREDDHKALMELAKLAGFGMTSLPQDADVMREKIASAVASFTASHSPQQEEEEEYSLLFVLEDPESGAIAGCTGVKTHVGLSNPFYSYKLSTIVQSSNDLGIYSRQKVLHMVNDYTGATEIGSLFLHKDYRKGGLGRFLSRLRFLLMAEFPQLFSDIVIAEMRGVHDENGDSPFYNNLARHFFQMPFYEADYINATKGNQFITELMPRYPIYVTLLPEEAREVIGKPYKSSAPAANMLIKEGFYHAGYIDVFDGGPTLQAERERIKTVRESKQAIVGKIAALGSDETHYMICNTDFSDICFVLEELQENGDGSVTISPATAEKLRVKEGDKLRYAL